MSEPTGSWFVQKNDLHGTWIVARHGLIAAECHQEFFARVIAGYLNDATEALRVIASAHETLEKWDA